jgi:hypothetical protein
MVWIAKFVAGTVWMLWWAARLTGAFGVFPLLYANPALGNLYVTLLVVSCAAWAAVLASRGNIIAALRRGAA